jgi:1,4-dihydroxy-2-naphthoyl-CoA hydrolase
VKLAIFGPLIKFLVIDAQVRFNLCEEKYGREYMDESAKLLAIETYRQHSESLPDLLGIKLIKVGNQSISVSLEVTSYHLNPAHTSCHAATMVAIADTACGWGCVAHLPDDAKSFTTVDLNCNLLRAVTSGVIVCEASLLHGGRTTQIWDAIVQCESGKKVAAFRCTELLLY